MYSLNQPSPGGGARSATVTATSPTACGGPPSPKGRARACRAAFVSTNSITQGEQVAVIWKPLIEQYGIHIDFAHRTFRWDSESIDKAAVHVVIVGFSVVENEEKRKLYAGTQAQLVDNISPYLVDAPTVFIERRATPIVENIP